MARIRGGAGGGGGSGTGGGFPQESGSGGGGGFDARPAGVFVIKEGSVSWQPAVDVTRIVVGGQLVGIVVALVIRSIFRRRR